MGDQPCKTQSRRAFAETDRQVDSGGDRQGDRRAGRQTAITQHKYLRGQCYQRNERLFRSISSSSSILVAHAPSPSFIARFLIDDKAIYVSLMFPSTSLLFIPFPTSHPSRSLPLIHLAVYAFRILFFLSFHPHQLFLSLFFFLNSAPSAHHPRLSLPRLRSRLGCFLFFSKPHSHLIFIILPSPPPLHPLLPLTSFSLQALSPYPAVHFLFYLFHYLNSACHFSHFSSPSSLYTCSPSPLPRLFLINTAFLLLPVVSHLPPPSVSEHSINSSPFSFIFSLGFCAPTLRTVCFSSFTPFHPLPYRLLILSSC